MRPLRLAFAGTPGVCRVALAALHDAGYQVPLVLTQPDRPAGRGSNRRHHQSNSLPSNTAWWWRSHAVCGLTVSSPMMRGRRRTCWPPVALMPWWLPLWPDPAAAGVLMRPGWLLQHSCLQLATLARCRTDSPRHRSR